MDPRYPSTTVPSKRTGAFYAAYFAVLGAVLPFLGPFLVARGLGAVAVGLVTAGFSLAKLVYAPCLGRWIDGGRWLPGLLTIHLALASLAAAAVIVAVDGWTLGLALLVVGLGYGAVLPVVEAAVLERPPPRGYGFVRWWGSAGFIGCAGLAAALLANGRVDRFAPVLVGSLVTLTVVTATLETELRPRRSDRPGAWISGPVWILLAVLTLHQVTHGPYYAFFSIHLAEHGLGTVPVAALWSLAVLSEAVAFAVGGAMQRYLGLRTMLGVALCLTPVRWLLLALPPGLPVLILAQTGHAATFALAHLAGVQLVQEVVPEGARRNAQALYSGLCFGLGIVVGTAAAGPLYAAASGAGSFLVAAGMSVLVALLWFVVSPALDRCWPPARGPGRSDDTAPRR